MCAPLSLDFCHNDLGSSALSEISLVKTSDMSSFAVILVLSVDIFIRVVRTQCSLYKLGFSHYVMPLAVKGDDGVTV